MGTFQFCQNWKRNNQASFKLFSKVFEWIIIFGLLIGVFYFVQDVFDQYQSKKKGVKSSVDEQENITPPTISICFNPPAKMSVLAKYNVSMTEFLGFDKKASSDMYEEGIYKIGRDYNLTLNLSKKKHDETYTKPTTDDNFQVTEVDTFQYGRCLKITSVPEVTFEVLEILGMVVKLNRNIRVDDRPFIQFHITSETNSYGMLLGYWFDGKDFMMEANSNDNSVFYEIGLETKKLKKLKYQCSQEGNSIQCASKR